MKESEVEVLFILFKVKFVLIGSILLCIIYIQVEIVNSYYAYYDVTNNIKVFVSKSFFW